MRGRPLRRLDDQLRFKLLAAPLDPVVRLRPQSDAPQPLGDIDRAVDRDVIDGQDAVAGSHAGIGRGRVWGDVPGNDPGRALDPGHAIIGRREHGPLLKIDDAENDGREGGQGKDGCSQPDSQIVVDWSAHRIPLQSPHQKTCRATLLPNYISYRKSITT